MFRILWGWFVATGILTMLFWTCVGIYYYFGIMPSSNRINIGLCLIAAGLMVSLASNALRSEKNDTQPLHGGRNN